MLKDWWGVLFFLFAAPMITELYYRALPQIMDELYMVRTVLFVVSVIILWELFEFGMERFINWVCDRPHNEDEYPWV